MRKGLSFLPLFCLLIALSAFAAHQSENSPAQNIKVKEVSPFSYVYVAHKGPYTQKK